MNISFSNNEGYSGSYCIARPPIFSTRCVCVSIREIITQCVCVMRRGLQSQSSCRYPHRLTLLCEPNENEIREGLASILFQYYGGTLIGFCEITFLLWITTAGANMIRVTCNKKQKKRRDNAHTRGGNVQPRTHRYNRRRVSAWAQHAKAVSPP